MGEQLSERKVAILATDGFEEVELTKPREALEKAGAETVLIAPENGTIKAWNFGEWSDSYETNLSLAEADHADYDALLLPGGVLNPDKLRTHYYAVEFAAHFLQDGRPVAAICHGPQLLIETGKLEGRRMTSYSSIKTDIKNAGAQWVDREVVQDEGLITSRNPDDIPAFNDKLIECLSDIVEKPADAQ